MNLARLFENSPNIQGFPAGQAIFRQGDEGSDMYVLLEGVVELRVGDTTVETVDPGGIFGEMALVELAPRSASAIAQSSSRAAVVDRERFEFMVGQTPFFALEVMRVMAERLRRMDRRLA